MSQDHSFYASLKTIINDLTCDTKQCKRGGIKKGKSM